MFPQVSNIKKVKVEVVTDIAQVTFTANFGR